jgi:hypothetical protein
VLTGIQHCLLFLWWWNQSIQFHRFSKLYFHITLRSISGFPSGISSLSFPFKTRYACLNYFRLLPGQPIASTLIW